MNEPFKIAGLPARHFRTLTIAEGLFDECIEANYADVHDIQYEIHTFPYPNEQGQPQVGALVQVTSGVPLNETIRFAVLKELPFVGALAAVENVRTILFEMVTAVKAQYQGYLRGNQ